MNAKTFKYILFYWAILLHLESFAMNQKLVEAAQEIPSQHEQGCERSWSCGPNALARFFALSGLDFGHSKAEEFYSFMTHCPRSCGKPTTLQGYASCAGLAASAFYCLNSEQNSAFSLAAAAAFGIAATAPFIIEKFNAYFDQGKVGPPPRWLANYGNKILKKNRASGRMIEKNFDDDAEAIVAIKRHVEKHEPVIVLINRGAFNWHYITVYNHNYLKTTDKHIFDTYLDYIDSDGSLKEISCSDLVELMDFNKTASTKTIKIFLRTFGWLFGVDIGRFNIIYWQEPYA